MQPFPQFRPQGLSSANLEFISALQVLVSFLLHHPHNLRCPTLLHEQFGLAPGSALKTDLALSSQPIIEGTGEL